MSEEELFNYAKQLGKYEAWGYAEPENAIEVVDMKTALDKIDNLIGDVLCGSVKKLPNWHSYYD
jgi:hypothetical protein